MRKRYSTLALLAACVPWGILPMQAETVSPYTEHFENLVLDPPEAFAPPKWGRIVDAGIDYWGDPDYVEYSNPATGGAADAGAYVSCGSQNLYVDYVLTPKNDLLVTPAVTGEVSFYLKADDNTGTSSVQVFRCTPNATGNGFTRGELVHDYAPELTTAWKQFTLTAEPGTYYGFRLHYAGMDEFQAASAEIELKKSMRFASIEFTTDTWGTVAADETNHFNVSFEFTVMNNGDFDLAAGEDGYSVSLVNLTEGSRVEKTLALDFPLAQGATSSVLTIEADVDAGMTPSTMRFALVENLGGDTSPVEEVDVLPYVPMLTLHKPDAYDALTTPIDFGVVTGRSTQLVELSNDGGAPLTITAIGLPEGFATTVETPFSVAAQSDSTIALTYTASTPGEKTGQVVFMADVIGEQSHDLLATVPEEGVWYENFEAGTMPGNLIAETGWTVENSPAGLGTTGNTAWAGHASTGEQSMLITPLLEVREGEVLTFFAGRQDYDAVLAVYYSADRSNWQPCKQVGYNQDEAFSAVEDPDAESIYGSNPYELTRFTVDNIPAGKWYVAFESGNARLDDIYGYHLAPVDQDWYITASNLPDKGTVNHSYAASITASNLGTKEVEAEAYTATLYFNDEAVATAEATAWAASESKTFEFAYTPHKAGEYTAQVVLASGDYTVQTTELTVKVAEETASEEIIVGNATSVGYGNGVFNMNYNNSGSETVYTAERLGLEPGAAITSIAFMGYAGATDIDFHVQVWMENTTDASCSSTTPRPVAEMTLVYDGVLQIEEQGNAPDDYMHPVIDLSLAKPFVYTGNNLRVATMSMADEYTYNVGFAVENGVLDASISFADDYEADRNSVSWGFSNNLPVIRLTTKKEVATVSGTVTDETGAAVADATVTLVSGEVIYGGTTDADGHYNIEVFQPDKEYVLTVAKEGYPEATASVSFADGSVVRDIVLGQTTGLDAVAATTLVLSTEGRVRVVTPAAGEAAVYSLTGVLMQRSTLSVGSNDLYLAPGSYVVKVNGTTHKVIVK